MKIERVPLVECPYCNGVQFGRGSVALLDDGNSKLVWSPGGMYYANSMSGMRYGPSSLALVRDEPIRSARTYKSLKKSGGRLESHLRGAYGRETKLAIDEWFDADVAQYISRKHTVKIYRHIT